MSSYIEVTQSVYKVLLKYNLRFPDIKRKHKRGNIIKARKEIAYLLVKDYKYSYSEVMKVLNVSSPTVTHLIHSYCEENNLMVPKVYHRDCFLALADFLSSNSKLDKMELYDMLEFVYQAGYRTGWARGNRAKSSNYSNRGYTEVPPSKNNAPVSFLEASTGLLNEVLDGEITTATRLETADS